MSFTSIWFLVGFPVVVFIYYLIPNNVRKFWLLLVSYLFVVLAMPQALVWLAGITVGSHILGEIIRKKQNKKLYLVGSIVIFVMLLLLSRKLDIVFTVFSIRGIEILAPIGISFYLMQAISYLVEIYRGNLQSNFSLGDYALYLSFFPKFLSGPIERPDSFLQHIQAKKEIPDYDTCKRAAAYFFWGYFEKIVVADHAAIVVNMIFEEHAEHTGFILLCGAILYGIQLYADFDGYCHIAMGAAEFLGYHITGNFERPYLSKSIGEFWRRWHISLSSWLRDYVYIPLGGSRLGKWKTYMNIIITFLVSGIWHGIGGKFLFWGMLHGLFQIISRITAGFRKAVKNRLKVNSQCLSYYLFQGIMTFLMVDFAWIFFRADSLRQGIHYVNHMCRDFTLSQIVNTSIYGLNIDPVIITTMIVGIIMLLVKDILLECQIDILAILGKQNLLFRWVIYGMAFTYMIVAYVQMIGMDRSQFIYGQF